MDPDSVVPPDGPELMRRRNGWWCGWRRRIPPGAMIASWVPWPILASGYRTRRWATSWGEWRGGVSPPRSLRTGREPLSSSGSQYPAVFERLCRGHAAPPVTGWPPAAAGYRSPFGPVPLQDLRPYYGLLRPCAPHRYSGSRGGFPLELLP